MKKITGRLLTLVLAMAMVLSSFTVSAYAKSGKSTKADKKASAAAPQAAASATIALDEAKEIAMSHAGADSMGAVFSKVKLDKGVYALKFSDPCGKYEYEISAADGTVLDYEWDVRSPDAPAPAASGSGTAWEGAVSRKEAGQAALDAAGVDEAALKYLTCYVLWTNHVPPAYEVKFATRWAAYRYTIGLDTGAVLDSVCHSHR